MCMLSLEEIRYIVFGHMDKYNELSLEREKILRSMIRDNNDKSRSNKRKQYDKLTEQLTAIDKRFDYWKPILRERGIDLDG